MLGREADRPAHLAEPAGDPDGQVDQPQSERTGDPDDGRASRVGVSEHGTACLEKGAAVRRALIAQAMAGWSDDDRETLRTLLHRLSSDLVDIPTPHHIDAPVPTTTLEHQ